MRLQNMAVIFVIIMIPIIIIFSVYTRYQINILRLQIKYDKVLNESVYDTVKAYQLNTLKNTYATVSDSMRRDINAAANAYITSLATGLGAGGYSDEALKPYIPALVFTLYDGYYIYTPTYNEEEDTYEHMLKPYIYYTARYEKGNTNVVINYTLDNYIMIYGIVNGEYVTRSGYLITEKEETGIEYLEETIYLESVENGAIISRIETYNYIYEKYNETGNMTRLKENKLYYDSEVQRFFYIRPNEVTENLPENINEELEQLGIAWTIQYEEGEDGKPGQYYYYRTGGASTVRVDIDEELNSRLLALNINTNISYRDESFYFRKNLDNCRVYLTDEQNTRLLNENVRNNVAYDDSAIRYYNENMEFTEWVTESLGQTITSSDLQEAVTASGSGELKNQVMPNEYIFNINPNNDPERDDSSFTQHKRQIIRYSIQNNLQSAIATYNENSRKMGSNYNFKMPILTEEDWDKLLSEISVIGFLQGLPLGLKYYNNYSIVTNTKNRENITEESMYFIGTDGSYHKIDCPYLQGGSGEIRGYKNIEFEQQTGEKDGNTLEYYKHQELACYYCIVNSLYNNSRLDIFNTSHEQYNSDNWRARRTAYYKAISREKQNKYKTNEYLND